MNFKVCYLLYNCLEFLGPLYYFETIFISSVILYFKIYFINVTIGIHGSFVF